MHLQIKPKSYIRAPQGPTHVRDNAAVTDTPPYLQPFVLGVPRVDRERRGSLDVYRSAKAKDAAECPVVILVHGGPMPADLRPTPRDGPGFVGYACALTTMV